MKIIKSWLEKCYNFKLDKNFAWFYRVLVHEKPVKNNQSIYYWINY